MVVVHWIRHGQSTANEAQLKHIKHMEDKDIEFDRSTLSQEMYKIMDEYPDAELTQQGRQEALTTRETMQASPDRSLTDR